MKTKAFVLSLAFGMPTLKLISLLNILQVLVSLFYVLVEKRRWTDVR